MECSVGVRWTVGDVSPQGFEALRLSILGAWRLFGSKANYAVCFNSVVLESLRVRVAETGCHIQQNPRVQPHLIYASVSYLTFAPPARSSGTNRLRAGIMTAGRVLASITAFSAIIPFFARRKAVRL